MSLTSKFRRILYASMNRLNSFRKLRVHFKPKMANTRSLKFASMIVPTWSMSTRESAWPKLTPFCFICNSLRLITATIWYDTMELPSNMESISPIKVIKIIGC